MAAVDFLSADVNPFDLGLMYFSDGHFKRVAGGDDEVCSQTEFDCAGDMAVPHESGRIFGQELPGLFNGNGLIRRDAGFAASRQLSGDQGFERKPRVD